MPVSERLEQIIGEEAALAVQKRFGGSRIYVPARMPADHPLVDVIGQDAAQLLSREIGGWWTWVSCDLVKRARNHDIVTAYCAGVRVEAIAAEWDITERQVWKILRKRGAV